MGFQRLVQRVGAWVGRHRALQRMMSAYPPYLGAGVRVTSISPDVRTVEVEMPLTPLNRNYVGTHFGGSLYSMCDPFFMLILMENLGPDYVVWDKSATVHFLRPGRGKVRARASTSRPSASRRSAARRTPSARWSPASRWTSPTPRAMSSPAWRSCSTCGASGGRRTPKA
jgi:acyl-coenzyme A thioesterase PaaI-like protein